MKGDLANISRLNRVRNDFILRQILLKLACKQTGRQIWLRSRRRTFALGNARLLWRNEPSNALCDPLVSEFGACR